MLWGSEWLMLSFKHMNFCLFSLIPSNAFSTLVAFVPTIKNATSSDSVVECLFKEHYILWKINKEYAYLLRDFFPKCFSILTRISVQFLTLSKVMVWLKSAKEWLEEKLVAGRVWLVKSGCLISGERLVEFVLVPFVLLLRFEGEWKVEFAEEEFADLEEFEDGSEIFNNFAFNSRK